jgi:hypothetical protein
MRNALRSIALAIGLLPGNAAAQSAPPNLPYHSVWGRLGAAPGDTGPGEPIPFAALQALLGPVFGPGSSTTGHLVLWNNGLGTLLQDGGAPAPSATTDTTNANNITSGSLPNARLANMNADTVKCNNTVSSAVPADCPAVQFYPLPGGRLVAEASSCSGALPVQLADVAAAGIICYVPYLNTYITVNGTSYSFSTLSSTITGGTSGKIYDLYIGLVSGAPTLLWDITPWTNSTTRASTLSALQPGGYYTNTATLTLATNGTNEGFFAAGTATYVGSVYMITTNTMAWQLSPIPLSGGTNNCICVFNAYNQVPLQALERELDAFWVFGNTAGSWEFENNNQNNQFRILDGLGHAQYKLHAAMAITAPTNTGQVAGAATMCYDCVISGGNPNNPIGTASQAATGGPNGEAFGVLSYGGAPWPGIGWGGGGGSVQNPLGLHEFSVITSGNNAGGTTGPEWFGNITSQATVEFND